MKRLKLIMTIGLTLIIIALGVAAYHLVRLYGYEKEKTMEIVRECVEIADILEITSRMKSGDEADQAFVRLNTYMEFAQTDKFGSLGQSDTLRTSLANLLRFGLEFQEDKSVTDYVKLDSIFTSELNRHGLYPSIAEILPVGSQPENQSSLWTTQVSHSPATKTGRYDVYVSPMPGIVLSHMWGIIIPIVVVILIFGLLSAYLIAIVKNLRSIERMKDDFTHNMTHELKTPVAVAYSAADSMLRYYDQSDEARNKQFLKIILQRLSFLSGMIENILSMSMERFKAMKLNIETVRLKPIVEEVAGMIELKADKSLNISIEIPDNLTVYADSLHLGNVFSNLLDNAIKYSGDRVNITIKADAGSISVADDGIGIDKDHLPFIFDKFYRVSSGDLYEAGGYGLGLYYVKQIIGLLGWNINVTSRPGKGTIFTIKYKSNEER